MTRLRPLLLCVLLALALAYYVYTPLPDNIQEPWKLMVVSAGLRTSLHLTSLIHWLGCDHHIRSIRQLSASFPGLTNVGDSNESAGGVVPGVKISDTTFDGIPVRVFEPPAGGEGHLRRGLMNFPGGEWFLGGVERPSNDALNHMISDELNTVVVSVEYRLPPNVHFPVTFMDCLTAAKHFLSFEVLAKYSIDPERVAVAGASLGGNLAAGVAQEISTDDSMNVKFSIQALIYPMLQALDFNTPSYSQNQDVPLLQRSFLVNFWLRYLGADVSLQPHLLVNNHSSSQNSAITRELRARYDWTVLLPLKHKTNHKPVISKKGSLRLLKEVPGLLDIRASPLLARAEVLAKCPRTYMITCENDVLRDDGLMYARRLQDSGVMVTNVHYEEGFHGCFSFMVWPLEFDVGRRAVRGYIHWLQNNL